MLNQILVVELVHDVEEDTRGQHPLNLKNRNLHDVLLNLKVAWDTVKPCAFTNSWKCCIILIQLQEEVPPTVCQCLPAPLQIMVMIRL